MRGSWFKFNENGSFSMHGVKGSNSYTSYCIWNDIEPLAGKLMFMIWHSNEFTNNFP